MLKSKEEQVKNEKDIPQDVLLLKYIEKYNFKTRLEYLNKKLKNKSVLIYGAGSFFEVMHNNYDFSKLNIIGIADQRFVCHSDGEKFLGYKVYSPDEIKNVKPDYVLVATQYYINIIEHLSYKLLKGTKIKVKPLLKKDLLTLINEVWK